MNNISGISHCAGCMACADRCPQRCISFRPDKVGHLYPSVDTTRCTQCGACLKVCPEAEPHTPQHEPQRVIAAWRTQPALRYLSSSGGVASAIAEQVVADGGVAYGCAFEAPFAFRHVRCSTPAELSRLRGSKYVQSDLRGTFRAIRQDLKNGTEVLFTGTPCQVAAVKKYFPQASGLLTIDLICHGVPPVRLLQESLPRQWRQLAQDWNVVFRQNTTFQLTLCQGQLVRYARPLRTDLFLKNFFTALAYRSSCHHCRYACSRRVGDLTLGDFWGLPDAEGAGVSLCLVNTEAGQRMMQRIAAATHQEEHSLQEALAENRQLSHPMPYSLRARWFRRIYPLMGMRAATLCALPDVMLKNYLAKLIKPS